MLTRRHLRVKVLQSLYAYKNQENASLQKEEKFLLNSMDKTLDLYVMMLSLMLAIKDQAEHVMEISKNKHLATEADKKPSRNFIDNTILKLLENDPRFNDLITTLKINNWQLNNEYPQILFKDLKKHPSYQAFLAIKNPNFRQEKEFVLFLYKEIIAPNEKLYDYLEDSQLTWVDDIPIVNTAIVKVLNSIQPQKQVVKWVPQLFKNLDDKEFANLLLKKTIAEDDFLMQEIEGRTPNWDRERIAEIDLLLIKMALIEFLYFNSIPVKVTINEYLEIAKEYSTNKSSLFINGLLDKLSKEYLKDKKIIKMGRGLL